MGRYRHVSVSGKTIPEHRLIWEKAHGPIPSGCDIHHKNGRGKDNRLENLIMLTRSEHLKLHAQQRENGTEPPVEEAALVERARAKVYRDEHKIELARKRKENYAANKDVITERNHRNYYSHREKRLKQQKIYYAEHRDECVERCRVYSQVHKDELAQKSVLYREKKKDELKAYRDSRKPEISSRNKAYHISHQVEILARHRLNKAIRDGKPQDVIDRLRKEFESVKKSKTYTKRKVNL